jgi:hypothetical protein
VTSPTTLPCLGTYSQLSAQQLVDEHITATIIPLFGELLEGENTMGL